MPQVARVNDMGEGDCPSHRSTQHYVTHFTTGASSVLTNNLPTVVVNGMGDATCGHPTHATTGSTNVFAENQPIHRVNDIGTNPGPYHTTTGSPNVFANS